MGLARDMKAAWRDASAKAANPSNHRRNLTEEDRLGWMDAMDQREKAVSPRTIQQVQRLIRNRNPLRWGQMQRDFRWVQKEMKKMGLNPEDARYIL